MNTDSIVTLIIDNDFQLQIDPANSKWLENSTHWSKAKENIVLVHGYAGGDNSPPTLLLRDAFVQNGHYNLFMIDYGAVSRAPCYVSLVQNIKYVSNCLASYLRAFLNSGMQKKTITCIGHSMGAHVCGMLRRYLGFRIRKIIGESDDLIRCYSVPLIHLWKLKRIVYILLKSF